MDYALAAMEQMELYCQAQPGSPAAVRPLYLRRPDAELDREKRVRKMLTVTRDGDVEN